jgi:HEAT repeat protein
MLILKLYQVPQIFLILLLLVAFAASAQASEDQFSKDLHNLSHEDAKIRGQAAWALGKSGDSRAVGPLIQAFEDKDKDVRHWAGLALVKIGRPAVEELVIALESENESVRWQAAAALGLINDSSAVEPLIMALFNKSNEIRYCSAISLGQIRDSRAREPLVYVLGNGNKSVRAEVGRALLAIDGSRAVDSLVVLLKDSQSYRRVGAAEALALAGDRKAVQPLIQALGDPSPEVRAAAAGALGALNDSRAVEPLISALGDSDSAVRDQAVKSLVEIGRPASEALIKALDGDEILIRQGAAEALGEMQESQAIEPLIAAFSREEMREVSVEALLKINKSSAVEPLLAILGDGNATDDIKADAAWALGELGDPRANEALLQAIASSVDNEVKMNSTRAMTNIRSKIKGKSKIAMIKIKEE